MIVFPADRTQWVNYGFAPVRIKSTTTSKSGEYRHPTLPAGEYLVAVVDGAEVDGWQAPAFLERISVGASRITLEWGGKATVDLVLASQGGR